MNQELVNEMFAFVADKLAEEVEKTGKDSGCDHSFRFTREFIRDRGLNERMVMGWIVEHGAMCDCRLRPGSFHHALINFQGINCLAKTLMSCTTQRKPFRFFVEMVYEMFAFVADKLTEEVEKTGKNNRGCDHGFRFTREFIRDRGLNERMVMGWIVEHGVCCDCQVELDIALALEREGYMGSNSSGVTDARPGVP